MTEYSRVCPKKNIPLNSVPCLFMIAWAIMGEFGSTREIDPRFRANRGWTRKAIPSDSQFYKVKTSRL
jgi:hypothetical protein